MRHGKKFNHLGRTAAHRKAMIELVDINELYNAGKPEKKKSTRRSRRGGKKAAEVAAPVAETKADDSEE